MSDQEILRKLRSADPTVRKQSMQLVCKAYTRQIHSFLLKRVDNKEDREELLQDIMAEGLLALSNRQFVLEKSIIKYLLGIANNLSNNYHRKRQQQKVKLREITLPTEAWIRITDTQIDQGQEQTASQKLAALKEAFIRISAQQANKPKAKNCGYLLSLKYIQNFEHKEIAQMLGKKEDAVKMKIKRCRETYLHLIKDALKKPKYE